MRRLIIKLMGRFAALFCPVPPILKPKEYPPHERHQGAKERARRLERMKGEGK